MRLPALALLGLCAVTTAFGSGCMQQDYDKLVKTNRSLKEQLVAVEEERDTARANLETLREQLGRAVHDITALRDNNGRLTGDLDSLANEYESLLARVKGLEVGALPEQLSSALSELAASYPDVLTFNERTGMLRFASDFTFDLGSADLKPSAAESIRVLSRILNTADAQGFEARVIGHTDNVPIRRADTVKNHPTNVHLSAHRAIAVRKAMVDAGVVPVRIMVAGYGEHRPVVENGTRGAAENRRVEIFLVSMPALPNLPTSRETSAPTQVNTTPRPGSDEPLK